MGKDWRLGNQMQHSFDKKLLRRTFAAAGERDHARCACSYKMKAACLVLALVFLLAAATDANALNTGFSTETLPAEKQDALASAFNITLLTAEPSKRGFLCFDVNAQGMVALGRQKLESREVCVYSPEGEFLYGYSFYTPGDIGVEWDGAALNIYFARSSVLLSLDAGGRILDMKSVPNTVDNIAYSNNRLQAKSRTVGDTTYRAQNQMGIFNIAALSYAQLVAVDGDGQERVIYDAGSGPVFQTVALIAAILILPAAAIAIIIWQTLKSRRGR